MDTGNNNTENVDQSNDQTVANDEFCCICQKKSKEINCSKCYRAFHKKCVEDVVKNIDMKNGQNIFMNHDDNTAFVCTVCKALDGCLKYTSMEKQTISRSLKYLMEAILRDEKFNGMVWNGIIQKIDSQLYDSLGAFLVDITYIGHHNITQGRTVLAAVNELLNYCKSESKNIIGCAECYENMHTIPNKWQTLACSRPHLVIWVKLDPSLNFWAAKEGYDYWPAKMMSYIERNVRVMFFKGTEFLDVPESSCSTYSQNPPKSIMGAWRKDNEKGMKEALEEVNEYAQNIEKKFGRFQISSKSVQFSLFSWCIRMRAMFPDYSGPREIIRWDSFRNESNESNKNSKGDETEKCSDNDNDVIPNKRQRLPEIIERDDDTNSNPMAASNISSFNDFELNSNPACTSNLHEEFSQTVKHLEDLNKKIENTSQLKIQVLHQELVNKKQSNADYQATNNDLLSQLNAERHRAIHEVAKIKEEHAKEITALNEIRNQEAVTANKKIEKDKQDARNLLAQIQKQHSMELDSEKRLNVDKLKKKMENMEQYKRYLQNEVNNHRNSMLEFLKKLKKNHENELNKIHDKSKIELESEKKRAADEMEKLSRKVAELEHKVTITLKEKSDVEAELKKKCDKLNRLNSLMSED